MKKLLLLLGTIWFYSVSGNKECPEFCVCNKETHKVTCTDLKPLTTVLPDNIEHFEVQNVKVPRGVAITENYFAKLGLNNVSSIKIVNSSLVSVDKSAFHGLTGLVDVNLSYNKIRRIDPLTFEQNPNIKSILLGGNPLNFTIEGDLTTPVLVSPSLETLYLNDCKLKEIPLLESENIQLINLRGNRIKRVAAGAFHKLDSLEEIDLADNFIDTIDPEAFGSILDLTTLNLARNPLTHLANLDIEGLKSLDMSGGKLHELNEAFFGGILDLNSLNMSYNLISSIEADTFSGLTRLMYIDLSNNLFTSMPEDLFENNRQLEKISLSGNSLLKKLPVFKGNFQYLEYYDVSGCKVVEIPSSSFSSLKYLTTLNVSNNEIATLQSSSFSELKNIRVIDLSNNKIKSLPPDVFEQNHELTRLFLKKNLFHQIPIASFEETPNLFYLDFSSNKINELWSESEIEIMQNTNTFNELAYLDLSGNLLNAIQKRQFEPLSNLRKVDLQDNQFSCNEDFFGLIDWLYTVHLQPHYNGEDDTERVPSKPNISPSMIASEFCLNGKKKKGKSIDNEFGPLKLREGMSGSQIDESDWDEGNSRESTNDKSKPSPQSANFGPITLICIATAVTIFAFGNVLLLIHLGKRRRTKEYNIPPTPHTYSDRRSLLPLEDLANSSLDWKF